jgi:ABC-2 type transport system ATP-binding protein
VSPPDSASGSARDAAGVPAASPALLASELSKSYRSGIFRKTSRAALRGVSFEVQQGEIFGYLGPNGSGKSTTLKILLGLIFADGGRVQVLGRPLADRSWRYRIGYLPEHPYFYDYLTPTEYLGYAGRLFEMPKQRVRERSSELLELVGLRRSAHTPLRRFSKGMVQRLGLAQALLNEPELLILDEPMSGLDPIGRRMVRDIIQAQRERGRTVFFSTHILSDAETLCDRIGVLRGGELLAAGRLQEILRLDASHVEVLVAGLAPQALDALPASVQGRYRMGDRIRLHVAAGPVAPLVAAVEAQGGRVLQVQPVRQSLEDYFFKELGGDDAAAQMLETER